jgi:uncharacterized Zn finger protein
VTVEYQRQRAKEMTKYFQELKFEEKAVKSKCACPPADCQHS